MFTVADILKAKGTVVHRISPDATVFEAITAMSRDNVGALLVTEGKEIKGIITERDYLRQVALKDRSSRTTPVRDIMTTDLCFAGIDDAIEEGLSWMTRQRCRHLPILDENGLAGLVSIGDLVKQLVSDRETEIRHLRDYIQGRYPG
jgi:CBS domain-containing protein